MSFPPQNIEPPKGSTRKRPNWGPNLPEPPFSMTIIAPRKSGKTVVIDNLLNRLLWDYNEEGRKKPYFMYTVLCSPTAGMDASLNLKYVDKLFTTYTDYVVQHVIEVAEEFEYKFPILLILDDILGLMPKFGSDLAYFITRNRHYNISVIITSQVFKGMAPVIRENTSNWVIFKIPNENELKKISEEIVNFDIFYDVAVMKASPYSFLYVKVEGGRLYYYRKFDDLLGYI